MLSSLSSGEGHKFESLPLGVFLAPLCNRKRCMAARRALQGRAMRIVLHADDWLQCSESKAIKGTKHQCHLVTSPTSVSIQQTVHLHFLRNPDCWQHLLRVDDMLLCFWFNYLKGKKKKMGFVGRRTIALACLCSEIFGGCTRLFSDNQQQQKKRRGPFSLEASRSYSHSQLLVWWRHHS